MAVRVIVYAFIYNKLLFRRVLI